MVEKVLVVQGGKLIDGTGRPAIENSVIVIQAGKFQTVGGRGEVSIPADAQVIDVKGKTVLPGFIDGHGHLEDFHGELYLHLGITTCATIELYQDGPWTLAQNRAPTWVKFAGRGFGCRAGRSAASAPGTMPSARAQPATTSSSQRPKKCAERCGGKRNSAATSSRSMSFFPWIS